MSYIEIEKNEQKKRFNMPDFHSHDYYEVYFLLSGIRDVFIENKLFTLQKNSICVIPPYNIHKTEGNAYSRINIYVSKDFLTESELLFLDKLSQNVAFKLSQQQMNFIYPILNEGATIEVGDPKLRTNFLLSVIKTAISYLATQSLSPLFDTATVPKKTAPNTDLLRIVSFINENYQNKISLDSLSKQFFVSKNTLCKWFKNSMNCSVIQYVLYVRLNKAKLYLTSTNKTIEQIYELCGFPSANYFSLIFKKHVGVSPSDYRKQN